MTKTNETLTWYIKNWADSGKLGVCTSHLHLCNLTMNCSELPNFSYTHPLAPILKNDTDSQHTKQEQSKPLKSQLTTKVCFAHAFLPTLKKDYVI